MGMVGVGVIDWIQLPAISLSSNQQQMFVPGRLVNETRT